MASSLNLVSDDWILVNNVDAFVAQTSRAFASALFASVIFAASLGVIKLAATRFELAAATARFSAESSVLILSTKACCSGGKGGPKKPPLPPARPPGRPGPSGPPGAG